MGRKQKFGEETVTLTFRVPVSKVDVVKAGVKALCEGKAETAAKRPYTPLQAGRNLTDAEVKSNMVQGGGLVERKDSGKEGKPELPKGLTGIDLTIWKNENWK